VLAVACRVIADRGADATRFADVATAAAVGVSTLQYYFGSRDAMLVAAFRFAAGRDIETVRTALSRIADPRDQLRHITTVLTGDAALDGGFSWRLWIESWRWAVRDPEVHTDVVRDYATWRDVIASTLARGVAIGRFRADLDVRTAATQVLALTDGLALPIALGSQAIDADQAAVALQGALARLTR
jgi:AcrR family transcriptional regulator